MVALPLVFKRQWENSDLKLAPDSSYAKLRFPRIGWRDRTILSGRDGATGKAIALQDGLKQFPSAR